jgi:hypothetical protein
MKKNLHYLVITLFLGLLSFKVAKTPMDEVIFAIKNANTTALINYIDNAIEIALPDKNDNYNKTQAEIVLKDFFAANSVKGFIVEHKGSNNGSEYAIGTLSTQKANFRMTIYMKSKLGKSLIQEIRIENKR